MLFIFFISYNNVENVFRSVFSGFLIREAVDDQHCRPRTEKKRECKFHNKITRLSKKV